MATVTTTTTMTMTTTSRSSKLVCFSFATYARTLIGHLQSAGVPVLEGLTDSEFTSLESVLSVSFPPDLRSILQEGVPVGQGFPDWRSSSPEQLQILSDLPRRTILKLVAKTDFWCASWGERPDKAADAVAVAGRLAEKVPVLVPVHRNCYVPSRPCSAGNPVFYINGGDIRLLSFDLVGFFRDMEFTLKGALRQRSGAKADSPAWATTAPRMIEFWSEAVEAGRPAARGWWARGRGGRLGAALDEAFSRLRDGGWRLEEVREMLMDGSDQIGETGAKKKMNGGGRPHHKAVVRADGIVRHLRALSAELLRGGWSREDVADSLGVVPPTDDITDNNQPGPNGEDAWLDYQQPENCDGGAPGQAKLTHHGDAEVDDRMSSNGNARELTHVPSLQGWLPKPRPPRRHQGNK